METGGLGAYHHVRQRLRSLSETARHQRGPCGSTNHRGGRRASASGLRRRGGAAPRPVPSPRRFPVGEPGRICGGLPLASAPRDRNGHVHADGRVEHEDSLGNKGIIGSGDVQWMTSGSGIIHQEMPKVDRQRMGGFQLWVNLPKTNKMMDPRYQEVKAGQIPEVEQVRGVRMRVVAGNVNGVRGPVQDVVVDAEYLDVRLDPRTDFVHPVKPDHTVFAYLLEGRSSFDETATDLIEDGHLVIFDKGDSVRVKTRNAATRLLLVSGRPLNEPIAWWGPIVMNNRKEIEQAVEEFQNGTFIKRGTRA